MSTITRTPRRSTAALVTAALALAGAASGCGSGDPGDDGVGTTATAIAEHFGAVTGDRLDVDYRIGASESLSLDRTTTPGMRLGDRYGTFSILVTHDDDLRDRLLDASGGERPDARGFRWRGGPGGWTAVKTYDNVILRWTGDAARDDPRLRRLDLVLSTVGRPAAQVKAKLPASDRPCAEQGMAVAGTADGTCRDTDGRELTVVSAGRPLALDGQTIRLLKARTAKVIEPGESYRDPARAKGRFVAVRLRLTNTGGEPLRSFSQAQLRIGERLYDADSTAAYLLEGYGDTFPLQPGTSGTVSLVFDIPAAAAAQADEAAVVVPAGDSGSVRYGEALGALRLGDAVSGTGTLRGIPRT